MVMDSEDCLDVPDDLNCSLCSQLLRDAVMLPCCAADACYSCARACLDGRDSRCPVADCRSQQCSPDDLIPNRRLRHKADEFRSQLGIKNLSRSKDTDCNKETEIPKLKDSKEVGSAEKTASDVMDSTSVTTVNELLGLKKEAQKQTADEDRQHQCPEEELLRQEREKEQTMTDDLLVKATKSISVGAQRQNQSKKEEDSESDVDNSGDERIKLSQLPDIVKSGTVEKDTITTGDEVESGTSKEVESSMKGIVENSGKEESHGSLLDSNDANKSNMFSSSIPHDYLVEAREDPLAVFNRIMEERDKQKATQHDHQEHAEQGNWFQSASSSLHMMGHMMPMIYHQVPYYGNPMTLGSPLYDGIVKLCHFCQQPGHVIKYCPIKFDILRQQKEVDERPRDKRPPEEGYDGYSKYYDQYQHRRQRECFDKESTEERRSGGHYRSLSPRKSHVSKSSKSPSVRSSRSRSRRRCQRSSPRRRSAVRSRSPRPLRRDDRSDQCNDGLKSQRREHSRSHEDRLRSLSLSSSEGTKRMAKRKYKREKRKRKKHKKSKKHKSNASNTKPDSDYVSPSSSRHASKYRRRSTSSSTSSSSHSSHASTRSDLRRQRPQHDHLQHNEQKVHSKKRKWTSSSNSECEPRKEQPTRRVVTIDSKRLVKNPLRCAAKTD